MATRRIIDIRIFKDGAWNSADSGGDLAALDYIALSEKAAANGVATLDGSSKVPADQLPAMDYIPTAEKAAANGVATLDENSKVPADQLPAMDYIPTAEKAAANGVATLDGNSKVPADQLPAMDYIPTAEKAATNGVATLDQNSKVPADQLPAMDYIPNTLTANKMLIGGVGNIPQEVETMQTAMSVGDFSGSFAPLAVESNWTDNFTNVVPSIIGDRRWGIGANGTKYFCEYTQYGWNRSYSYNVITDTVLIAALETAANFAKVSDGIYSYNATSGDVGQQYYANGLHFYCVNGTLHTWLRIGFLDTFTVNNPFTSEGGICVILQNKTGANTVKGSLVSASSLGVGCFQLQSNEFDTIGIVYDAGIVPDGMCRIVVTGIAEVLLKDTTASTAGNWVIASDADGRADASQPTPSPNTTAEEHTMHFKEIGHCIETKTAGTNVLAKCIIHFN